MDKQGLILGLDIEDKRTQIAYFHEQSGKVSPINDDDGKAVFDNQVSLNKILSEKSSDGLAELIERMLNEAKVRTESEYIEKVCFVIHRYTEENRQLFREALEKAGLRKEQYIFAGDEEAFAYYTYDIPEAVLYGTRLINYTEFGIESTTLRTVFFKGYNIIGNEIRLLDDKDICAVAREELDISVVEDKIVDFFRGFEKEQKVSSIYLTGPGFDRENISENIVKSINSRGVRIFAGQNLFVKGACIMATACILPAYNPFSRSGNIKNMNSPIGKNSVYGTVLACKNRTTTSVALSVLRDNEKENIEIVSLGKNIDEQERSFECILTDRNAFQIYITPIGKTSRRVVIDLNEFPVRENKTTRVRVSISFANEDVCTLSVQDLGFGELFKSSGKTVTRTFDFNDEENTETSMPCYVLSTNGVRSEVGFSLADTGVRIHSVEELCYYIYSNIFLVQKSFFNSELLEFIANDLKLKDLADKLYRQIKNDASLNFILLSLFKLVDYYSEDDIKKIEPVLDSMETADPRLRLYSIAKAFIANGMYGRAIPILNNLTREQNDSTLPISFIPDVYNVLGIAYANLFMYRQAAECFEESYKGSRDDTLIHKIIISRELSDTKSNLDIPPAEYEQIKNMLDEFDDLSKKDIDEASDNGAALISKFKREYKKKTTI